MTPSDSTENQTGAENSPPFDCYCYILSENPEQLSKKDIPEGHFGHCDICDKPGHLVISPVRHQQR
jgi:hypothetical protein